VWPLIAAASTTGCNCSDWSRNTTSSYCLAVLDLNTPWDPSLAAALGLLGNRLMLLFCTATQTAFFTPPYMLARPSVGYLRTLVTNPYQKLASTDFAVSSFGAALSYDVNSDISINYDSYLDVCDVTQCTYTLSEKYTWLSVITVVFGLLGGLSVALRYAFTVVLLLWTTMDDRCRKGTQSTRGVPVGTQSPHGADSPTSGGIVALEMGSAR